MKKEKDIERHLNQLLSQADSMPKIKTSAEFTSRLNARIDQLEQDAVNQTRFTPFDVLKYAAIIVFLVLNLGAFYSFSLTAFGQSDTTDQITEIANEYFPDYTAYAEME